MPKIKIEKVNKEDLVVNGKVYKKGWFYHVTSGDNIHHAYYLKSIYKVDKDWMLRLGEQVYDAETATMFLEISHPFNYRKCECSFTCDGYVLRDWKWI